MKDSKGEGKKLVGNEKKSGSTYLSTHPAMFLVAKAAQVIRILAVCRQFQKFKASLAFKIESHPSM